MKPSIWTRNVSAHPAVRWIGIGIWFLMVACIAGYDQLPWLWDGEQWAITFATLVTWVCAFICLMALLGVGTVFLFGCQPHRQTSEGLAGMIRLFLVEIVLAVALAAIYCSLKRD